MMWAVLTSKNSCSTTENAKGNQNRTQPPIAIAICLLPFDFLL